jgi:pilus assembly protein CpaC
MTTLELWRSPVTRVVVTAVAALGLTSPAVVGQEPPPPPQAPAAPAAMEQADRILLIAGRSMVLTTEFNIERLAITDETVADAIVVQPREVLINGKQAGTISLILWGEGRRVHHELVVEPAVTTLEQRLHAFFPGEDITVSVTEGAVILSGRVSSNEVMLRAGEIAGAALPELQIINMLQLPGGAVSQQVMLQVRFAEVNRSAIKEAGINLFATRSGFTARSTTQQFAAPDFDDDASGLVFSDFLNIFFFQREEGIGGVLKALEQRGWFESLAEPNLIAYNGKEASFLAGGEIPVPVVSGNTGNVSVEWREFGVRLTFTPTIAGDVIRLHVRPEVSALDFNNGITISGFRIPALTTRYAETEVELRDGQSFAIAGLLDTTAQNDSAAIPVLSQIPIIGHLFKSRADREDQTELMVLITPRLVRPLNPDEVPPLPTIDRGGRGGTGRSGGPGGPGGGGGDKSNPGIGLAAMLVGPAGLVDLPARPRDTTGSKTAVAGPPRK